ncbi:MAG: hypothetical protein WCM76_15415 [Bacteroidota bacterium]
MSWIKEAMNEAKQHSEKRSKQKQFGFLLLALLIAALAYAMWKNGFVFNEKQMMLSGSAMVVAAITMFYSKFYYPLLFVWLLIGNISGIFSSFIIFVIIYFSIITPIALFTRLIKSDSRKNIGWIVKKNIIDYRKLS